MKIRKNGKVINLTESDLRRIVTKVIKEQDENGPLKTFTISAEGGKHVKTGNQLPGPFTHKVEVSNPKMKDTEGKSVTNESRYQVRVDGRLALEFQSKGDLVQIVPAGWKNLDVYAKGVIIGMVMKDLGVNNGTFVKEINSKDPSIFKYFGYREEKKLQLKKFYTNGSESLKLTVS